MTPAPITFQLESHAAAREVLRLLANRLQTKREASFKRCGTYYDTFDWRLHRDKGVLFAEQLQGGWSLHWELLDGSVRLGQRTDKVPAFAWELPHGRFRQLLEPLIDVRRLLALVRVDLEIRGLCVLDSDHKTVLRVEVEHGTAAKPQDGEQDTPMARRLRLVPVRGYKKISDRVVQLIESELGLQPVESGNLAAGLKAVGLEPVGYSSKFHLQLDAEMRADRTAKSIHRSLLETILANQQGVRENLDSEFLHDFRVAVRRTRSCLGQLKKVLPKDHVNRFSRDFSWLGKVTGPTRDLDVYLLKMPGYRDTLPKPVRHHLAPLQDFIHQQQRAEQKRLVRSLDSRRYRELIRDWQDFLKCEVQEEPSLVNAARPIIEVATERIRRCYHRVIRDGKTTRATSPAKTLHRLRIDCKKLRYLLEFFRSLYDSQHVDLSLKALKRLQDNLGEVNDLEIQREALQRFAIQMSEEKSAPPESLLAMGRLVDRLESQQARQRKQFTKCLAGFDDRAGRDRFRGLLSSAANHGLAVPISHRTTIGDD